jgi:hypothetical protein
MAITHNNGVHPQYKPRELRDTGHSLLQSQPPDGGRKRSSRAQNLVV